LAARLGEQGREPERGAFTLSVEGGPSLLELLLDDRGYLDRRLDGLLPDALAQIVRDDVHIHKPGGRGDKLQLKSRTVTPS
jgi:hypothetical protein